MRAMEAEMASKWLLFDQINKGKRRAMHDANDIPATILYSCTRVYKMRYDRLSNEREERRRLSNVTNSNHRREKGDENGNAEVTIMQS